MNELIQQYNSYVGLVNKLGEYVQSVITLPPQGDGAKEQFRQEVDTLFRQLAGQEKALKRAMLEVDDE